ncbi:MAG: sugar kinase [Acidimicrobiia bacterium]
MTLRSDPSSSNAGHLDAVCIGETMVSFVETDDPRHFAAIAAGAESNVAIGMARLGLRTRWVSRIGDDPLGRFVEEFVASSGVDVSVIRDPERVTGVMIKHPSGPEKISSYYRSESAARLLDPDDLHRAGSAPLIHVTGITPALSQSALGLVQAVVDRAAGLDSTVSFDFNYRAKLWPDAETAATVLLPLARDADVVFIGDDEARLLFGSTSPPALADLILRRTDQELVLKRGSGEASVVTVDGESSVPTLPTTVIDVTGAGDAFAAGYLAAGFFGWPTDARLRLGHFMAARVVGSLQDIPPALSDEELMDVSPSGLSTLWNDPRGSTDDASTGTGRQQSSTASTREGRGL